MQLPTGRPVGGIEVCAITSVVAAANAEVEKFRKELRSYQLLPTSDKNLVQMPHLQVRGAAARALGPPMDPTFSTSANDGRCEWYAIGPQPVTIQVCPCGQIEQCQSCRRQDRDAGREGAVVMRVDGVVQFNIPKPSTNKRHRVGASVTIDIVEAMRRPATTHADLRRIARDAESSC